MILGAQQQRSRIEECEFCGLEQVVAEMSGKRQWPWDEGSGCCLPDIVMDEERTQKEDDARPSSSERLYVKSHVGISILK